MRAVSEHPVATHRIVRYRDDTGFEMQCALCRGWWPLSLEYWTPKSGLVRCKGCWRAYFRAKERGYRSVEAVAQAKRDAGRLAYWVNRDANLAAQRRWRAAHREETSAYNRAYRAAHKAELAAKRRAYHAECRSVILTKKRVRYAEGGGTMSPSILTGRTPATGDSATEHAESPGRLA